MDLQRQQIPGLSRDAVHIGCINIRSPNNYLRNHIGQCRIVIPGCRSASIMDTENSPGVIGICKNDCHKDIIHIGHIKFNEAIHPVACPCQSNTVHADLHILDIVIPSGHSTDLQMVTHLDHLRIAHPITRCVHKLGIALSSRISKAAVGQFRHHIDRPGGCGAFFKQNIHYIDRLIRHIKGQHLIPCRILGPIRCNKCGIAKGHIRHIIIGRPDGDLHLAIPGHGGTNAVSIWCSVHSAPGRPLYHHISSTGTRRTGSINDQGGFSEGLAAEGHIHIHIPRHRRHHLSDGILRVHSGPGNKPATIHHSNLSIGVRHHQNIQLVLGFHRRADAIGADTGRTAGRIGHRSGTGGSVTAADMKGNLVIPLVIGSKLHCHGGMFAGLIYLKVGIIHPDGGNTRTNRRYSDIIHHKAGAGMDLYQHPLPGFHVGQTIPGHIGGIAVLCDLRPSHGSIIHTDDLGPVIIISSGILHIQSKAILRDRTFFQEDIDDHILLLLDKTDIHNATLAVVKAIAAVRNRVTGATRRILRPKRGNRPAGQYINLPLHRYKSRIEYSGIDIAGLPTGGGRIMANTVSSHHYHGNLEGLLPLRDDHLSLLALLGVGGATRGGNEDGTAAAEILLEGIAIPQGRLVTAVQNDLHIELITVKGTIGPGHHCPSAHLDISIHYKRLEGVNTIPVVELVGALRLGGILKAVRIMEGRHHDMEAVGSRRLGQNPAIRMGLAQIIGPMVGIGRRIILLGMIRVIRTGSLCPLLIGHNDRRLLQEHSRHGVSTAGDQDITEDTTALHLHSGNEIAGSRPSLKVHGCTGCHRSVPAINGSAGRTGSQVRLVACYIVCPHCFQEQIFRLRRILGVDHRHIDIGILHPANNEVIGSLHHSNRHTVSGGNDVVNHIVTMLCIGIHPNLIACISSGIGRDRHRRD